MGEEMIGFGRELRNRWKRRMPPFFRRIMRVCGIVSGTALAANEAMQLAGIAPHEWWTDTVPYLVAVPAGVMAACKLTVEGGYGNPGADTRGAGADTVSGKTVLDKDNF